MFFARSIWIGLLAAGILSACAPDYTGHQSSASPDGKYVVDVTTEYQPANDPDVFWQHVSIRSTATSSRIVPGNVAIYSCRTAPKMTWKSNTLIELEIDSSEVGSNFSRVPETVTRDGVKFVFKLAPSK